MTLNKQLELVSLREAQELVHELRRRFYFHRGSETVSVKNSVGRELAKPVLAQRQLPSHNLASMDGYAVRTRDSYPLKIAARCTQDSPKRAPARSVISIATGARLPPGFDAVLKMEDANVRNTELTGKKTTRWENVIPEGIDYRVGSELLRTGRKITPQDTALLHSLGLETVSVYRRLRVAIISTGDEVLKRIVKNTTAFMLHSFLHEWGCTSKFLGVVPDDLELTKTCIRRAIDQCDVLITTAGVSVGERDFVARAFTDLGSMVLHGVKIRPGKPLAVAVIRNRPVFGLPGKPTGSFSALELIVKRYFLGDKPRPVKTLKLSRTIKVPSAGFQYVVYVSIYGNRAIPLRKFISPLGDFLVSRAASCITPPTADGYILTSESLQNMSEVEVNLLT
jgi:molybdenum cofactor synthesis domain-containing protein